MKKLLSIILLLLIACSALASIPEEIPFGQEMEFTGAVTSCKQAFGNLWAVRISAGEIDVIGYLRHEIPAGQEITMRGAVVGTRDDPGVVVVLNPAVALDTEQLGWE